MTYTKHTFREGAPGVMLHGGKTVQIIHVDLDADTHKAQRLFGARVISTHSNDEDIYERYSLPSIIMLGLLTPVEESLARPLYRTLWAGSQYPSAFDLQIHREYLAEIAHYCRHSTIRQVVEGLLL
jgi:hypothetical protein